MTPLGERHLFSEDCSEALQIPNDQISWTVSYALGSPELTSITQQQRQIVACRVWK